MLSYITFDDLSCRNVPVLAEKQCIRMSDNLELTIYLECTKNTKVSSLRQNFDEIDHMAKITITELEVSI